MNRKDFFNRIAGRWDREHQGADEQQKLEKLFQFLTFTKKGYIFDVGCGTGRLVPFIQNAIGGDGVIVAADFSEKMLCQARRNHCQRNLFFIQADAQKIGLNGGCFDEIICFASFPHFPDKPRSLAEFRRILRPKGSLYIAHLMSCRELNDFHRRIKGPVCRDFLPDENEMRHLFDSAGFRDCTIIDQPSLYIARGQA